MASFNKVLLIGNLTRDPELRYTPSGAAVAGFSLAINRQYNDHEGNKKEDVTFIRIVVWGKRAEVCNEYLKKGSGVLVEGRIQSRSWEAQDGSKRSTVEVVAENVQFLTKPKDTTKPSDPDQMNENIRDYIETLADTHNQVGPEILDSELVPDQEFNP